MRKDLDPDSNVLGFIDQEPATTVHCATKREYAQVSAPVAHSSQRSTLKRLSIPLCDGPMPTKN